MNLRILLILLPFVGLGQSYEIANIPKELLVNATAVVRQDKLTFDVKDKGNATETTLYAVSVFSDAAAEEHATLRVPYNKLTKIKELDGKVYDAFGNVVFKVRNSDIRDVGMGAYQDDISDNRLKIVSFDKKNLSLPFTIEYSYTTETQNLMFYPSWTTGVDGHTAVEQSSLTVSVPDGVSFRHLEEGFTKDVKKTVSPYGKTISWEVKQLPSREAEAYTKDSHTPTVYTAPVEFEVQGIEGSFNTWEDFAKFYLRLNQGRGNLPDATVQKVRNLTKNLQTTEEKVATVYKYLQATTHYLNISLGIGGWQTIPAENVASKGYGDCKALTNYFNAMLAAVGIEAYGALVQAGDDSNELKNDFPISHFNHIISCVPTKTDTLWLECTSQTNPFGYQGDFTGNRRVLLIKPTGGGLVETIRYRPEDNRQNRKIQVKIDENGDGIAAISTNYSGLQQETISGVINRMTPDEQRKWLLQKIDIGNFELEKFTFGKMDAKIPKATESLSVKIRKCATKSGKRLFITPNLMTTFFTPPTPEANRKSNLYLNENRYSFVDSDTVTYDLPDGFVVEYLPKEESFAESFGSYKATVEVSENRLTYYRTVRMQGGTYPPETYYKFIDFLKNVKKADRMRVVYVEKKT